MKPERSDNLDHLFEVRPANKAFRRIVPRRIEYIRPFKDIGIEATQWMKTEAYNHAGLSEYNPCWTGEMASRPIPFVSTDERPKRTQLVFEEYIGDVLRFLAPDIVPAIQAINKISALGDPVNGNPGDGIDRKVNSTSFGRKVQQSKFDVVLEFFAVMLGGDFSAFDNSFHTIGTRKQNDPPSKLRMFQFITSSGHIIEREVGPEQRAIEVPDIGPMIGSRTRTIVRPPIVNLFLQCWDTLLHNAIKKHPLFDSNVYTRQAWAQDSHFVTFDCKHYERYLGLCAISYANAIGGAYQQQLLQMIYDPFIVPSDDWTTFWEIKPKFGPGVYPQFSSGLSPVAPLGKLANICVQVSFFHKVKKMDVRSAIATVFSGTNGKMRRWSFGDDNRVMGDPAEVDEFCTYMGSFFDIEIDDVPQYLGTIWRPDHGRWFLPRKTYNLKLYQPERDFEFKDYPNLGMVERRATFTEFGEPEIASDIIPFENDLWNEVGHPYVKIVSAAIIEKEKAAAKGIRLNEFLVTDKDYLMTEQERAASGLFWHLTPDVTATIVLSLVGAEMRERLPFRGMRPSSIPKPDSGSRPFSQAGIKETQLDEDSTDTIE